MKKTLIISSFILVLVAITTIGYNIVSANVTVENNNDIICVQTKKELYLTPYGYTLDNPNIIKDPYGISPLTALILFETEEKTPVTITVVGKDDNSTYTNTFTSNTKHYIPVYGLYANYNNKIILKTSTKEKEITIETSPLPPELINTKETINNTNNLTFISNNTYPYALDNNNEVRWYLNKKYIGRLNYLENGNLLLGEEKNPYDNQSYSLIELNLLGRVSKRYILDTPYLGDYQEANNTLTINSTKPITIDKQTGTLKDSPSNFPLNKKNSSIETLQPLYTNNTYIITTTPVTYNLTSETKVSKANIFLIGYQDIDATYNNYNIKINKTDYNLSININLKNNDKAYLILDKFLDKKVYDLTTNYTIINKHNLSGKYSIYLKINNTIYKTNNYVKF